MRTQTQWPLIYSVVVMLTAAAFLLSVRVILSPVIVYMVLLLLISPWAGTRHHLLTVHGATLLIVIWLLKTLGSLLAPFILALVLAYILDPSVDRLQKWGLRKRALAVAVLALPVLTVFVLALVFGVPAIVQQVETLIEQLPAALQRGVTWLQNLRTRLLASDIPFLRGDAVARMLDSFSPERVAAYIEAQQAQLAQRAWGAVIGVGKGLTIALSILGYVVLTPVLTIYLLLDFDRLTERARAIIPIDKRAGWLRFIREYDSLLSRYLRGQILAATMVGILTWLGLWIAGFPYPALVGAVAGVFNLVPYLGLVVSVIPVIIISLLSGNILASFLKAAIVFAIVQVLDSSVVGPRIVGGSVGLHPVWVILALAVGGFFFGFVGLLLAMPAAVFIKLIVREAMKRYQRSGVYEGELQPEPDEAAG
ncbi:MAG TPA: AI-2E family transporter [Longimicrobiales bacterium]